MIYVKDIATWLQNQYDVDEELLSLGMKYHNMLKKILNKLNAVS